ncbi:MAG: TIM-barrel protein [Halobacteriales archaeon]|jgi:TIM-barrel protein
MFSPPVVLASLSGRSDADWALAAESFAGGAFLGGIAIDEATREAARELIARDRSEFLPQDPLAFLEGELQSLQAASIRAGVNVRSGTIDPIREAAKRCRTYDAILEINAHCRQQELVDAGTGHALLRDTPRLVEYVAAAAETGATVSVKVRAGVDGVDLPRTSRRIEDAGADVIHVDAMDSEPVVSEVVGATDAYVIANNEVRDRESVHEYLSYGADAVSVGRPSDDPTVLRRVQGATREWFHDGSNG